MTPDYTVMKKATGNGEQWWWTGEGRLGMAMMKKVGGKGRDGGDKERGRLLSRLMGSERVGSEGEQRR